MECFDLLHGLWGHCLLLPHQKPVLNDSYTCESGAYLVLMSCFVSIVMCVCVCVCVLWVEHFCVSTGYSCSGFKFLIM